MIKRRRFKKPITPRDRLTSFAKELRDEAAQLPTGPRTCSREPVARTQRRAWTTGPTRRDCGRRSKLPAHWHHSINTV